MLIRMLKYTLIAMGAVAISSCWAHYHYSHGSAPTRAGIVFVRKVPPPPLKPRPGPRPSPRAVWIDGYWRWTGVDYVWIDGYWEPRPPIGKTWTSGSWVHTSRGWYWRPGRWR